MKALRTPESRFTGLKDYSFQAHYSVINNMQLHYIDEGPHVPEAILLLHGVPSWSYLYRHIIRTLAEAGHRVIAPDLIGFGKSEKPDDTGYHSFGIHIDFIYKLINILHLKNIILFGHDWGSLIGLRIAADHPELFRGIIISNGMLPTGDQKFHITFKIWKILSRYSPILPVDLVIESGTLRKLDKEEKRAYNAPFPSSEYKAGIRAMPGLVPATPDNPESKANITAWESLGKWTKPFLTVFSSHDPITRNGDEYLQNRIPGALGLKHTRLNARHFIQEDRSAEIADIIISFKEKADYKFS